jgi:hypothetical protein
MLGYSQAVRHQTLTLAPVVQIHVPQPLLFKQLTKGESRMISQGYLLKEQIKISETTYAYRYRKPYITIKALSYGRADHTRVSKSDSPEIRPFFDTKINGKVLYALYEPIGSGKFNMYIGQSNKFKERVGNHKEKQFTKIIAFTSDGEDLLDDGLLNYLEKNLIKMADESRLINEVINNRDQQGREIANAEEILEIIKNFIQEIIEVPIFSDVFKKDLDTQIYTQKNKSFEANLKLSPNRKIILCKASKLNPEQKHVKDFQSVINKLLSEKRAIFENGCITLLEDITENIEGFDLQMPTDIACLMSGRPQIQPIFLNSKKIDIRDIIEEK